MKNIIIYLDEAANITNVFMTYIKNINGVKGEEIKDFPKCSLEVTDEFVGKKPYHVVNIHPFEVISYIIPGAHERRL